MTLGAIQQVVKLRSRFQDELHALPYSCQVSERVFAETDGALVIKWFALARQCQFDSLRYSGWYIGNV